MTEGIRTSRHLLRCTLTVYRLGAASTQRTLYLRPGQRLLVGRDGDRPPALYDNFTEERLVHVEWLTVEQLGMQTWQISDGLDIPAVLVEVHHDLDLAVGHRMDRPAADPGSWWHLMVRGEELTSPRRTFPVTETVEVSVEFSHPEHGRRTVLDLDIVPIAAHEVPAGAVTDPVLPIPLDRMRPPRRTRLGRNRATALWELRQAMWGDGTRPGGRIAYPDNADWVPVWVATAALLARREAVPNLVRAVAAECAMDPADKEHRLKVTTSWRTAFSQFKYFPVLGHGMEAGDVDRAVREGLLTRAVGTEVARRVATVVVKRQVPPVETVVALCRALQPLAEGRVRFFPEPEDLRSPEAYLAWQQESYPG